MDCTSPLNPVVHLQKSLMLFNRFTDYSIRVVAHLAVNNYDRPVSAHDIAVAEDIPGEYIKKVLQQLVRAGFVASYSGKNGGVKLIIFPGEISVLDLIEKTSGPIALSMCLVKKGECPRDAYCPIHALCAELQEQMIARLKSVTIANLLSQYPKKK